MHSPELLEHFENPRNIGELGTPAVTVEVSNPACGDILRLSARLENGIAKEVRYKVRGCVAAIAAGSALTEWMTGKTNQELAAISIDAIEKTIGELPPASKHVAALCADAVKALLKQAAPLR
jgi:nitrogen fixation NifU-like protein